ncbi:ATP-binding protein [soil metagenome]
MTTARQRPITIIVAGPPAVGKTTFGAALARSLPAAFVDKDTLTQPLVAAAMRAVELDPDALDHPWYRGHLRPAVYATLTQLVADIVANGTSVVLVAPYLHRAGDPTWLPSLCRAWACDVRLVWLRADPAAIRRRLIARGAQRDQGKLTDWDAYATTIRDLTPSNPDQILDTSGLTRSELEQAAFDLGRAWSPHVPISVTPERRERSPRAGDSRR